MMGFRTLKTKEVADICGVTEECIRQNAKKVGIVLENGKAHEYTEDELKKIQLVLMKNQTSQGTQVNVVKENLQTGLEVGLATNILANSGDVEAMREFCEVLMQKTQAQHDLLLEQQKTKELEAKNQLLIEQKEAAEAETERIFKHNENFHHHLKTATELAKEFDTSPNRIGRIANKLHLKQEPIYGKLGKAQLNNGRWIDVFYYNEDAQFVIAENLD